MANLQASRGAPATTVRNTHATASATTRHEVANPTAPRGMLLTTLPEIHTPLRHPFCRRCATRGATARHEVANPMAPRGILQATYRIDAQMGLWTCPRSPHLSGKKSHTKSHSPFLPPSRLSPSHLPPYPSLGDRIHRCAFLRQNVWGQIHRFAWSHATHYQREELATKWRISELRVARQRRLSEHAHATSPARLLTMRDTRRRGSPRSGDSDGLARHDTVRLRVFACDPTGLATPTPAAAYKHHNVPSWSPDSCGRTC